MDKSKGFTIIELLIAMALSVVVMALVGSVYYFYSNMSQRQERTVEVTQNLRGGLFALKRDLFLAGYRPNPNNPPSSIGLLSASSTALTIAYVASDDGINNDGDLFTDEDNEVETITYSLGDGDGDGDNDLLRQSSSGTSIIIENVENIEFLYREADGTAHLLPTNLLSIKSISVSLLVKSLYPVQGYTSTETWQPLSNTYKPASYSTITWGPYNDHFLRKIIFTTIYLRNVF